MLGLMRMAAKRRGGRNQMQSSGWTNRPADTSSGGRFASEQELGACRQEMKTLSVWKRDIQELKTVFSRECYMDYNTKRTFYLGQDQFFMFYALQLFSWRIFPTTKNRTLHI